MRILHIDTGKSLRGGQHQVLLLLQGLRQSGHESILLARTSRPLAVLASQAGYQVHQAGIYNLFRQSRSADLVHAHDARAHTLAALCSQTRYVVSRRVAFPVQHTIVSRFKYGTAARYLAVSQFAAGQLKKAGVPSDRIDVVYDATEPGIEFQPCWQNNGPVVAPVFRNEPKKLSSLTEEACRLAGVPVDFSSALLFSLRSASVFVYLTGSEGLGSAALLAMSAGVPLVASRVEGLAEVFEHNISGLYVENNAAQAAAAIRRILDDPTLAERLRVAARARVDACFSLDRSVEATLLSYRRALAG